MFDMRFTHEHRRAGKMAWIGKNAPQAPCSNSMRLAGEIPVERLPSPDWRSPGLDAAEVRCRTPREKKRRECNQAASQRSCDLAGKMSPNRLFHRNISQPGATDRDGEDTQFNGAGQGPENNSWKDKQGPVPQVKRVANQSDPDHWGTTCENQAVHPGGASQSITPSAPRVGEQSPPARERRFAVDKKGGYANQHEPDYADDVRGTPAGTTSCPSRFR